MKPFHTLLFMLGVFAILAVIMNFYPKEGITIGGNKIKFAALDDFLLPDTTVNEAVLKIISDTVEADQPIDTSHLARQRDSLRKEQVRIHFAHGTNTALDNFFKSLSKIPSGNIVRIMHYGDSQIEGDRITGAVRDALQDKFGSAGPGLFPVVPIAPILFIDISYEGNWKRYPGFGMVDTTVKHKKYGALLAFSRFAPVKQDSILHDTTFYRAKVHLAVSKKGYGGTRKFSKLKMHWGNSLAPVEVIVEAGGAVLGPVTLQPKLNYAVEVFDIPDNAGQITVSFKGKDSPDIYGFSLEGTQGVIMDNIPLRGGSGTEVSKVNKEHLRSMIGELAPDLFVMEFGGNVLPYIEDAQECVNYGKWFESQIRLLKNMSPGASVLVIGPADMSVKENTTFVTHPFLENVRDALKSAAFNTGSAFWDMYGAMGGKNSMPVWVNADPPLAASDHIHFLPKGASFIASMFNKALLEEYEKWKSREETQAAE